jgi:hypothetical protein
MLNDLRVYARHAQPQTMHKLLASCGNALPLFTGVKWSQVQILSARPVSARPVSPITVSPTISQAMAYRCLAQVDDPVRKTSRNLPICTSSLLTSTVESTG